MNNQLEVQTSERIRTWTSCRLVSIAKVGCVRHLDYWKLGSHITKQAGCGTKMYCILFFRDLKKLPIGRGLMLKAFLDFEDSGLCHLRGLHKSLGSSSS